jgi:uncharacterized protein (DUF2141 family)
MGQGIRSIAGTAAASLLLMSIAFAGGAANLIQVDVTGLRNDKGQVLCDLFSSPVAFPGKSEGAIAHVVSKITNNSAVCEFSGVAPGRYAVAVVHDENANGKLDRIMGVPSEGVGTSRDARGHFGPPKFEDAAFQYEGGALTMTVKIAYLL